MLSLKRINFEVLEVSRHYFITMIGRQQDLKGQASLVIVSQKALSIHDGHICTVAGSGFDFSYPLRNAKSSKNVLL